MSNTIKLKRGSGSDPSASDLVLGELAIRTDNGKIFLKKDNGSVAEVSGGGITDGDKGDITVSNSGGTFTIDNNAVTFAKIEDIAQNRILGRVASGSGDATTLTAANVRTMINVEDGATADQTASEIVALIADQTIAPSEIDMEDNEKIKIGAGDDLEIFNDGTNTHFKAGANAGQIVHSANQWRLQNLANNENMILANQDGLVRLFFNGSTKLETTSYGALVTGTMSAGSGDFDVSDNGKFKAGNSSDLQIFHDGSNSYISEQGTGSLILKSNTIDFTNAAQNEFMARFFEDSAVELYFNGTKRIETNASGAAVVGDLAMSGELNLTNGGNYNRFIDSSLDNGEGLHIRSTNGGDANHQNMAIFIRGGAVELYHAAAKKFETASYGSVTSGVHSVSNGILELKAEIATSHTITTDYNAIAVDPTINSGVTVTVPSGAVWAIV